MANASINLGNGNWSVKESKLLGSRPIKDKIAPIEFDVTRASTATRVNKQGLIETVNSNIARIDYSNDAKGALLLEGQSTNLVTYSEDFSDSSWTKIDLSVVGGFLSPDGANNAYKITGTNISNLATNYNPTDVKTHSRTIYARTTSGSGLLHLCSHNSNTDSLFNITEQWQRFEVRGYNATGSTNFYAVDFRGSSTLTEVLVFGADAEENSYATSYIPTAGTTQTRVAETCGGAGSSSSINSEEGVLYAEISALADDGTNRYISLSDGTNNNDIRIYFDLSGYISVLSKVNGSTQVFLNTDVYTQTDFNKIAFKYKENDFALWINGVEVATDLSGVTNTTGTLNQLAFNGNLTPFYGNTKDLRVYSTALTDSELAILTTI